VPWALGPADGRYILRPHAGEDASHVVVLATVGAPQRRFLSRGRRARPVPPEPPATAVPVTRATVIDAAPLPGDGAAARWLREVDAEAEVAAALRALNRVIAAHRIAADDPGARDVTRSATLVVRLGYGAGEEVADGRHTAAIELPPARGERRQAALRSQERLSALLSGRDAVLAAERLAQRARADLDAGRSREAALLLRVALEAALTELVPWRERGDIAERIDGLAATRADLAAVANRALQGGLDPDEEATVDRILGRLEAAMRARAAAGFD
jgi:hypothetical protein